MHLPVHRSCGPILYSSLNTYCNLSLKSAHALYKESMASEKTILIVDDNVDAADLTADYLRIFGAHVSVAYGGSEALLAARTVFPDVIFLDIGMPSVDGYDVAKALRADGRFNSVTIIALTAWGDTDSRERSKAPGFDLHLTKPADFSTLVKLAV